MTQLNIPYQFVAGTKAKASEVNANFTAVVNAVEAIYTQMQTNSSTNSSSITTLTTNITSVDTKIDNFLATYSEGTKFCINSGKLDSSGNADILTANSTLITFDVDSSTPIKATNYKGKYFKVEDIDDLYLPTLTDGTYTLYLNEDGTVNYYSSTVQYVNSLPSAPSVNEVCFVYSEEPIKVYKYSGSAWAEFLGVPIGEFVIASGTISSITTYPYNQNHYNINAKTFVANITSSGWTKLPNGLIFQWGYYAFTGGQTVNFPIAFPNRCFAVTLGGNPSNIGASAQPNVCIVSKSQFKLGEGMYSAGPLDGDTYFMAIGY